MPEFDGLARTGFAVKVDSQLFNHLGIDQFFRQGVHGPDGVFDVVGVLVVVNV